MNLRRVPKVNFLNPNVKMLFHLFFPNEHHTAMEKIYTHRDLVVLD